MSTVHQVALVASAASSAAAAPARAGAALAPAAPGAPGAPGGVSVVSATTDCRLGYAVAYHGITQYTAEALQPLAGGQYVAFTTNSAPPRPAGLEYIQTVRMHQTKTCPDWNCPYVVPYTYTAWPDNAELAAIAQALPGSIWMIGNEIDRRDWTDGQGHTGTQDEMLPELYAQAYHDLYAVIKAADPSARVAIAGVIQATPLRLQYLDRVWDEYARRYGHGMPVDVWNVHGFMFREKRYYPGCTDCWGADVPPGIDVPYGMLYDLDDSIDATLFANQLTAFRQWMAERGERDKPLLVSEYGTFPPDYYDPGAVPQYILTGTFHFMRYAADPVIGYPGDENRLVQRWVFFSLDDDANIYGANLIEPDGRLSDLGLAWVDYVSDPAFGFVPRAPNLRFHGLAQEPAVLYSPNGTPVTATVYPDVTNSGSVSTGLSFAVRVTDSQWPLGGLVTMDALSGCGTRQRAPGVILAGLQPGVHTVTVQVDSANAIAESDETDNVGQVRLLVATRRILLPVVAWQLRPNSP